MANKINNDPESRDFNPVDMPYKDTTKKVQNKSNKVTSIDVKKVNDISQKPTK